jgi:hypothetical protein
MNGVLTKGGQRYLMSMINDASIYCYVYLLKTKDETLNYFKTYKTKAENQLEKNIKYFSFDRGGEYFSNEFNLFCAEHVLYMRGRCPIHPNQTGLPKERITHSLTSLIPCWILLYYLRHGGGDFIDFMSCPK